MSGIQFRSTLDVKVIQQCGSDAMLAAAAWVATSAEDGLRRAVENPGDVAGVINYLMKHKHGTPFEHSFITFFVRAPIFVWREWMRHRVGYSYNEVSGRYSKLEPVFYIPDRERPMMCVENWKPARPKFTRCQNDDLYDRFIASIKRRAADDYAEYEAFYSEGIDPGLVRSVLPVGLYSSCWVSCNPRSLMHFLTLRTHEPEHATFISYPLWEIELAARSCEECLKQGWPITYEAFCRNGRVAP